MLFRGESVNLLSRLEQAAIVLVLELGSDIVKSH